MRQIILDTETTGLIPEEGHRVIEIGAVELIERQFTGNNFHEYINPKREVEKEALEVHGLSNDFLADKPVFTQIMQKFVDYIKDAELIIHNAPFDVGFLNYEFRLADPESKPIESLASVLDTLALARKKYPGKRNSLDALCKRYAIDNSKRDFHGALLDAQLLAEVFLAMTGGQMNMFEESASSPQELADISTITETKIIKQIQCKVIAASSEEETAHNKILESINSSSRGKCLWLEN